MSRHWVSQKGKKRATNALGQKAGGARVKTDETAAETRIRAVQDLQARETLDDFIAQAWRQVADLTDLLVVPEQPKAERKPCPS